ncbi:hypothetical protein MKK84_27125 [Methylobacterium sp. E-065]|uniref:hypothetical protein n=1 Tax=Methylobacterium sp. E-065 TaxID=2836583 RepID=UPI001FBBC39B|nr:hypothetical protein [Methylobacterium sp. E-065]MCJ2021051.1 hypothetical protein [Methylobacterium sp. E-065]
MSNLALIQPRPITFRTSQNTDWLDGLPIVSQPGPGGVVAGSANIGNGSLAIVGVSVGAKRGVHVLVITGVAGGLAAFTVTDPSGLVTGRGVAGVQIYAGGLTLALAQGSMPFAVGDTFAVSVLPAPLDISGLTFALDARAAKNAATVMLQAFSAPADGSVPTIVAGTTGGNLAMRVLRATMARCPPGQYPFDILATDPATGLTVTAFYGLIKHAAAASLQD